MIRQKWPKAASRIGRGPSAASRTDIHGQTLRLEKGGGLALRLEETDKAKRYV